jgi:DNA-directed RNA polymerase sigma subunit (sigma70/sigma32)
VSADEQEALKLYLEELGSVQPLTKQEEARLFQEMQQEGERGAFAERRVLESHLHQVPPIAERYASSGLSMLDLVQEGNLGLMRAIKEFSKSHADDFLGYAESCIEDAIRSAIANRPTAGTPSPKRVNE